MANVRAPALAGTEAKLYQFTEFTPEFREPKFRGSVQETLSLSWAPTHRLKECRSLELVKNLLEVRENSVLKEARKASE